MCICVFCVVLRRQGNAQMKVVLWCSLIFNSSLTNLRNSPISGLFTTSVNMFTWIDNDGDDNGDGGSGDGDGNSDVVVVVVVVVIVIVAVVIVVVVVIVAIVIIVDVFILMPPAQSFQAKDVEVKLIWPHWRLFHVESAVEGVCIFHYKALDSRWNRKPVSLMSWVTANILQPSSCICYYCL